MESSNVNNEIEIDLSELINTILKNIKLIIISTCLGAILVCLFTVFFIPKKYSSSSRVFITLDTQSNGTVNYTSLTYTNAIIENYMAIMKSDAIANDVAQKLNVSAGEFKGGLAVSNAEDTLIIDISCVTKSPQLSQQVVNETIDLTYNEMKDSMKIDKLKILNPPKVNNTPVSPNIKKNTLFGAIGGAILSLAFVFIRFLLDNHLKTSEEAEEYLGYPVLGEVSKR